VGFNCDILVLYIENNVKYVQYRDKNYYFIAPILDTTHIVTAADDKTENSRYVDKHVDISHTNVDIVANNEKEKCLCSA